MRTHRRIFILMLILTGLCLIHGCAAQKSRREDYPDFITTTEDYYITRIGSVPDIDETTYRLTVTGLVNTPRTFTLEELRDLDLVELPLTVECIGNSPEGPLLSTAIWKGFRLYDLLMSLGVDDTATGVQYRAADGYYASHTLEQLKQNGILGALYMNGDVLIETCMVRIYEVHIVPAFHLVQHFSKWSITEINFTAHPACFFVQVGLDWLCWDAFLCQHAHLTGI